MNFNMTGNVLTVTDGNTDAFKIVDESCECCIPRSVDTFLNFERAIIEVDSETSYAYKTKKSSIYNY